MRATIICHNCLLQAQLKQEVANRQAQSKEASAKLEALQSSNVCLSQHVKLHPWAGRVQGTGSMLSKLPCLSAHSNVAKTAAAIQLSLHAQAWHAYCCCSVHRLDSEVSQCCAFRQAVQPRRLETLGRSQGRCPKAA